MYLSYAFYWSLGFLEAEHIFTHPWGVLKYQARCLNIKVTQKHTFMLTTCQTLGCVSEAAPALRVVVGGRCVSREFQCDLESNRTEL